MDGVAEFLIITGMSGAGRSQAANTFEDLGWFVIDNMPVSLITKVMELVSSPGSETERVGLVVGRAGNELDDLNSAVDQLRKRGAGVRILYLEAADDVLVRRFEDTRRRHPVDAESVVDAIAAERAGLQPVKEHADVVIDTSELNVHQLRDRLVELFSSEAPDQMQISVMSFGFKHGLPLDVDNVFDCRFLPNPHWVDELRPFTGLDAPVRDYVLGQPATGPFLDVIEQFLQLTLPAYIEEGKSYLSIAAGCTGGHHRSVVIAEEIARRIRDLGYNVVINHRDIDR
jgi:UPF0042 nucleotide-binding protein